VGREGAHLLQELAECGFVRQQNMVRAVKLYEARARDPGCEGSSGLERCNRIVAGVNDEGRHRDLPEEGRHINIGKDVL
jgi:hypothetical protein